MAQSIGTVSQIIGPVVDVQFIGENNQLKGKVIDFNDLKDIIKEKNNALFFNKDVVSSFEKITSTLKTETENVGFAIETNILRNNNPEKYELIKKTRIDFVFFYLISLWRIFLISFFCFFFFCGFSRCFFNTFL